MAKKTTKTIDFAFYQYIQYFLRTEHKRIYAEFKPLTKKFLSYNNPKENSRAYLRVPQFEALETYVFLKEFCHNAKLCEIFSEWHYKTGKFEGRQTAGIQQSGQLLIFEATEVHQDETLGNYKAIFDQIKAMEQSYPNYIFALTMGLGKTVLMATSIFYEFLLANKYPKDPLYCHNAIIFVPDKTVRASVIKDVQNLDKEKVVPKEYLRLLDSHLKLHFLDDNNSQLTTIDNSDFNIIISNSQKIILKQEHKHKTAAQSLFGEETGKYTALTMKKSMADLAAAAGIDVNDDDIQLINNARFVKLSRLKQLGIYVDEAHHVFGTKLEDDLLSTKKATSLRVTINELAANLEKAGTRVVGCYNYTGTPYVKNRLIPEVVYSYGLRDAIDHGYLKKVDPYAFENLRDDVQLFCRKSIGDFWKKCGEKRVEGMLPKMVFFATTIDEAKTVLRPAIEDELAKLNIPANRILPYVGDVSNDEKQEFNRLDTPGSKKQFIILVGRGNEGWNCRSLFAVAMYRRANSTVFVLQATMRCMRQIGDIQHTAYLFFSQENMDILNNELKENFNISLSDMSGAGKGNEYAEVRLVPPPVKIEVKKIRKEYTLKTRELPPTVDLMMDKVDLSRYKVLVSGRKIDDLAKVVGSKEDITSQKERREFSTYTLTAEIARYLNMSPLKVQSILAKLTERTDSLCARVNEHNELLYDEVIPRIFYTLYEIEETSSEENVTLELVKDPNDKGQDCYLVKYKHGLLASRNSDEYRNYRDKTFNVDNYCFDSKPEFEMFWTLLHDNRLEKVWFTGMLTAGQTDFLINYIDPESGAVRSYYPDFLVKKEDGSYIIIEVKGEDKLDDAVVLAKKEYAKQMAAANSMDYIMVPGKKAKDKLVFW